MDPAQHRPEVLPSSAPASEPRDERPSHDAIWGWHFLHDSGVLGYGDGRRVKAGGTLSVDVVPKLWRGGLHASVALIDALRYANGSVVCRVAVWGQIDRGTDKVCGLHRYASWMVDAERPLWDWLCDEAEARCCGDAARGRAVDERTWAAIAAQRAEMREVACDWTAIRSSASEAAEIAATLAAWEAVRVAEEAPSWKAARSAALLCGTNRSDFLACFIEGSSLRGHKLGVSAARQWVGGDHPGVRVPSS